MKKIMVLVACLTFVLVTGGPALAIELSPEAATSLMNNSPNTWVRAVSGDKVTYNGKSHAYAPDDFNQIMEAYGLSLTAENVSGVPANYAMVKGDKVVFLTKSRAYSPAQYHAIFTAYGLELDTECIKSTIGYPNYALKVTDDGQVVFGTKSRAFSPRELTGIMSCYALPVVEVVEVMETKAPVVVVADSDKDGVPDSSDLCPGTPAGAKIDQRGCWVLEQDYLFAFDKAAINPQYYGILDDVVVVIQNNPTLRVELEGHTDSVGSEHYNMGLSERRANSVRNYLIEKGGIAPSRLSTVGYGETRPIASNDTKEGRSQNRRVELNPVW